MTCDIYGVDTEKKLDAAMVRDAMIECFMQAHKDVLADMEEYVDVSEEEMENLKKLDVEILIKRFFSDVGGDFDHPDKESLVKVMEKLKEYAVNFRKPATVHKHYDQMMKLVEKLD